MDGLNSSARFNSQEIRSQIEKRIGLEKSHLYFTYLNKMLSKKLSKTEFDKFCGLILGKENLSLHNQLIKSIFQNASEKRTGRPDPPPRPVSHNRSISLPVSEKDDLSDLKRLLKRKRVEEISVPVQKRLDLKAPIGIPFCKPSIGGSHKPVPAPVGSSRRFLETGELTGTEELRRRMDCVARNKGLNGGVELESANLLNLGLDLYLKRIIGSCLDLVRAKNGTKNGVFDSIDDFRVAMEMNPQLLGEDWPLLLEKICNVSFEEKD
ncbi:hypothetical protein LUZ60_002603 [Juncus effusus]|nr:hypothetical protein LUZ60_002603 [Juncus effusus]